MSEKRMLIVEAAIAKRIEENRGDLNVSDFINFLIDGQLKPSSPEAKNNHITKEEFVQFEQGIKELLRNFLEFFLSYSMELGQHSTDRELEKLAEKMQALGFSAKSNGS
jgi:hypothetical protein